MKGQVIEIIIFFVILGVAFIALLIGSEVYDKFLESGKWPTTSVGNATRTGVESSFDVINYGMVFLIAGFAVAMIVGAFIIRVHPIFAIASILILIFVIVVAAPISNAFMGIATSDTLSGHAEEYSIASHVMGALPLIAAVIGILVIIALFAKPGGSV
jgi:hypothetical protein